MVLYIELKVIYIMCYLLLTFLICALYNIFFMAFL